METLGPIATGVAMSVLGKISENRAQRAQTKAFRKQDEQVRDALIDTLKQLAELRKTSGAHTDQENLEILKHGDLRHLLDGFPKDPADYLEWSIQGKRATELYMQSLDLAAILERHGVKDPRDRNGFVAQLFLCLAIPGIVSFRAGLGLGRTIDRETGEAVRVHFARLGAESIAGSAGIFPGLAEGHEVQAKKPTAEDVRMLHKVLAYIKEHGGVELPSPIPYTQIGVDPILGQNVNTDIPGVGGACIGENGIMLQSEIPEALAWLTAAAFGVPLPLGIGGSLTIQNKKLEDKLTRPAAKGVSRGEHWAVEKAKSAAHLGPNEAAKHRADEFHPADTTKPTPKGPPKHKLGTAPASRAEPAHTPKHRGRIEDAVQLSSPSDARRRRKANDPGDRFG